MVLWVIAIYQPQKSRGCHSAAATSRRCRPRNGAISAASGSPCRAPSQNSMRSGWSSAGCVR
jgi:hypothetical protein